MKKAFAPLVPVILTLSFITGNLGCKKAEPNTKSTLGTLYETYKNGSIEECKYNRHRVYSATINAYDAGIVVYNEDGGQLGTCNYGWGRADSICGQLTGCETIYRVENNIWGQPAVDKYSLGK